MRLPVIASGGVGTLEHFVEGARAGATGLLAASVFHFGTFTIAQVKQALAAAGLPVRLRARRSAGGLSMAKKVDRKAAKKRAVKKHAAAKKGVKPRRRRPCSRSTRRRCRRPPRAAASRMRARPALRRRDRAGATPTPTLSHSARLLSRGTAKVAQKFGEEAVECLIEAVAGNHDALIAESADVLYHLLVMWVDAGVAARRGLGRAGAARGRQRHRREGEPGARSCRLARHPLDQDPMIP